MAEELEASARDRAPSRLPGTQRRTEPIEVQEFLQSVVREFQWRVENHASEDTWSLVRYLNEDDLEKYTGTKMLLEPLEFTAGKVAVLIRTQEVANGFVRVQVSTHFQGNGKPTGQVFMPAGNPVATQIKRCPGAGTDRRAANAL